jgi:hypothetical protein
MQRVRAKRATFNSTETSLDRSGIETKLLP